jgi:hypothetical protein
MTTLPPARDPLPPPLSDDVVAPLRAAIGKLAHDPSSDDAPLRAAIAGVVTEAHGREMRPEQLIPLFKALIDSLPEMHGAQSRLEEARLRERLVTLCIKSYYAR